MSYLALARRWRPRNFDDVVGQQHVIRALSNALDSGRVHHAYLFAGTRGVGKTTLARILAKALNCETGVSSVPCGECSACTEVDSGRFVDLLEVDAASRTRVDDTRELLENVPYAPARGRFKVYLVDEVHMLSNHSFNALLKTLEEPPDHVKFLLATTDPQKLPVTVLSRCLQFNLSHLPSSAIVDRMQEICEAEEVDIEADALHLIGRAAAGSMRDGLSLLDQALAYGGGALRTDEVRSMLGTVERDRVATLLTHIARGDGKAVLAEVEAINDMVADFGAVLDEMATMLQRVAIAQVAGVESVSPDEDADSAGSLAEILDPEWTQLLYQMALHGRRDLGLAPDARLGFEMTLIRMVAFAPPGLEQTGPAVDGHDIDEVAGRDNELAAPASTAKRATKPRKTKNADSGDAPGADDSGAPSGFAPAEAGIDTVDWREILRSLPLDGAALQLAEHCALEHLTPFEVKLLLERRHELLLTDRSRKRLGEALEQRLGKGVRMNVRLVDVAKDTLAGHAERARAATLERARESIEDDPAVREMVDMFGASVDPDTVRPRESDA